MTIIPFKEKYADEMIRLYQQVYSEDENHQWSYAKAKESLEICWKYFPNFNFVALNDAEELMGGIFCLVNPYFQNDVLFIISIQTKPEFRQMGVAKELLKKAAGVAQARGITGIRLLTDERKKFPALWYEKLGFKKSGYVEYTLELNNSKFDS